ncbi:cystine transport system substrate-binding protein [Arthrobacter stackebrandtii]|uniref:Cystine transport system substrate-binding protein n=1 Tax=Arthrobacter stackebrandtii TaxID=272161 RepID=A0ABS4YTG6_9MICC|nr:amino acid ABC transporter substrate-binding protein [Arthrobacter stackebrandtii]MBP2411885.1 cystine transport system substrate-binding protein [Arthrobacter stackebrandtii]PYG99087.1 L-cystine-binding protein TcyA [Arthrobacter stackebrandtii]
MKRRSLGLVGILAAATLALAACGGTGGGSESGGSAPSGGDTSLSSVKSAGEIVFATEGTYKPFSYHEGGAGELTGYDVEVARAVADKLGVKAKFEETQWDSIFAGLEAKRFDAVANQVTVNPTRQEKYELSTPYTVSQGVIVTQDGTTDITSFADLKGKTTAQSLSSNWYTLAKDSGANVEAVEGWAQSVSLLKDGRVDAIVNDKLTFLDYQHTNPKSGLKIAATTKDSSESAFAFRKGSTALTDAVDSALKDLAADGTLAKLSEKYFGEDVSK